MIKNRTLYGFCMALLLSVVVYTGCGSMNGSGGGSGSGSGSGGNINLVINNPDPNSSGSAKALEISPNNLDVSKEATRASLNTCTLTVSGAGISTTSTTFSVVSGASQIQTSLEITPGSSRNFSVDCSDTSETTQSITVGYEGSTTADIGTGSNTVSLTPKFRNLVADDSDGVHFVRINQENTTQTKLTIGFGTVLTDAQKINLRCILEMDTSGSRTSLGVIDSNQSNGLTTSSKSGPYVLITGGLGRPVSTFYNSSDSAVMKLRSVWGTTSGGNTLLTVTFGIKQMKSTVDSDEGGQYAVACSLTGSGSYDLLPNSGYAKYDLDANSGEEEISLISDGSSCTASRNGETCSSGFCSTGGSCVSLSATNFTSSNANATVFVGPPEGTTSAASTDGVGTAARFSSPWGGCITPDGSKMYIANGGDLTIREVTISTANVTTFAGTAGASGTADGTGSDARFDIVTGCVIDPSGTNIYVADRANNCLRKIVIATAEVTTFAGSCGTSGSTDGTGTSARFNRLEDITVDHSGENLYAAERNNHVIRKIVISSQVVTTLAGSLGTSGFANGTGTSARFSSSAGITIDSTDTNLYVADAANSRIRKIVIATGEVTTLAGSGTAASTDGTGTGASFNLPTGIVIDPTDTNLYVTDVTGNKIRKIVISTGVVTTIAGSGSAADTNGVGTACAFSGPEHLFINPEGTILYVPDRANNKIRQIQIQ